MCKWCVCQKEVCETAGRAKGACARGVCARGGCVRKGCVRMQRVGVCAWGGVWMLSEILRPHRRSPWNALLMCRWMGCGLILGALSY